MGEVPSYDPVNAVFMGTKLPVAPTSQPKSLRSRSSGNATLISGGDSKGSEKSNKREIYIGDTNAGGLKRPGSGSKFGRPGSGNNAQGQQNSFTKPPQELFEGISVPAGMINELSGSAAASGHMGMNDKIVYSDPSAIARNELLTLESENRVKDILQSKYGVQVGKLNLAGGPSASGEGKSIPGNRKLSASSLQFVYDDDDEVAAEVLTERTAPDEVSKVLVPAPSNANAVIAALEFSKPRYSPPKQGPAGNAYRREKNSGGQATRVNI
jgi:hypothetical protein